MILSVLACALAASQTSLEPQRLRTLLPNGAAILVEQVPNAKSLSVMLILGTRGVEEDRGARHLLEHLVALGPDSRLDHRLETKGGYLHAHTLRDATVFEMMLPPGDIDSGLEAIQELLKLPTFKAEDIKRELKILREEEVLRPPTSRISEAAWLSTYGESAVDPFGRLSDMEKLDETSLRSLHRTLTHPANMAIVIAGAIDLDAATAKARKALERPGPTEKLPPLVRTPLRDPGVVTAEVSGEAVAVAVPSYRDTYTAAILANALGMASEMNDSFVTYTPSARGGLVILGSHRKGELDAALKMDPATLFDSGKGLARSWVKRQLSGPSNIAFWRGLLLVQEPDLRPETLLENIQVLGYSQFKAANDAFRSQAGQVNRS